MAGTDGYATNEQKGKLFCRENQFRKNDSHPIRTGLGSISKDGVRRLVAFAKETDSDEITLKCALWEKIDNKTGEPYAMVTFEPIVERVPEQVEPAGAGGGSPDDLAF